MLLWSIAYIIDILSFSANSGNIGAVMTIIFSVGFGGSLLAHTMLVKAQHKVEPLNLALGLGDIYWVNRTYRCKFRCSDAYRTNPSWYFITFYLACCKCWLFVSGDRIMVNVITH